MAKAVIVGSMIGEEISKLSSVITQVKNKTKHFKFELTKIHGMITSLKPFLDEMEILDQDMAEKFICELKDAQKLVLTCEHIKWNFIKKYHHSLKLEKLNQWLFSFFQIDIPLQTARDAKEALQVVRRINGHGGWSSYLPPLYGPVIGFDDRVKDLKGMVLNDSGADDCSVVMVSGIAGCGKTTLVTTLLHDPEIQNKFGRRNIYFASISSTPDLKGVIRNLLPINGAGEQATLHSEEHAFQQWGGFLNTIKEPHVLLILDDVWTPSIITKFKFKRPGYKILVTSRTTFVYYNPYELLPLNDQDAINLLLYSALMSESTSQPTDHCDDDIPDELVHKLVKYCNKHPLILTAVGGLLKGACFDDWQLMLDKLSQNQRSILDFNLNEHMQHRLASSLDMFK